MKKNVTRIIIPFIMSSLILSLNACSLGNKAAGKPTAASVEASQATENEDVTAKPADIDAAGNQILYDQSDIRITANGLNFDGATGPAIPVTIENGSKMNITVQVKSFSVNGYMQECSMSTSVPAGELLDSEISLITESLNRCGIEEVAEADIALHVFDDATWNTIHDSDPVTFKVKGMDNYVQNHDNSGEVLFDEHRIKIVSRGLSKTDGLFGPQVMLYIENNTEKDITIQTHDALVNNVAIDPMLSTEIMAGQKTVCSLSFMGTQLAENNIGTMDSLETKIHIFDSGWNTIVDTDSIAIKLK